MLSVRVFDKPDWPETLGPAWRALFQDAPDATPFQTFEWQSTWFKHYGTTKRPMIFAAFEGDDLVGLMPMVRKFGAWRTLRPMGCGPSDYLHPLARSGYAEEVAQTLMGAFESAEGVDLVDIHQARESHPFAQVWPKNDENVRILSQAKCLVLDLPKTYEEYLQMLGKSLRQDVRKLDKTIFSEGKASIIPCTKENVQDHLDLFFECHKLRWKQRGLPGAFIGKRTLRFHQEWGQKAVDNGWLWLSALMVEGEGIGAIYAMRTHDTCYFYQSGFDPAHKAISPGTLLVASTIRRAIEEGCGQFDFMRGDEPYKRRWKPQHCHDNLRLLMPVKALRGNIGKAVNTAGFKVESKIRARLEGKSLR
ncbi:MAG: GNAT family N-acetyltransferase [Fimbriimonadaceae bacterium]|nr:GNAT family N-acetyltransferase [Fimbriimonadaceae bacterium]